MGSDQKFQKSLLHIIYVVVGEQNNQLALTGEEGGPVQGVQEQVHPDEFAKYSPCKALLGEECGEPYSQI